MTSRPTPLSANQSLDREFLELRAQLLNLAASLDRLDRGDGTVAQDARIERLHAAIQLLTSNDSGRAEQLQLLFSLPYDESWRQNFQI